MISMYLTYAKPFRNRLRGFLTIATVATVFVLLGLLGLLYQAFHPAVGSSGADMLVVTSRYSSQAALPISLRTRLAEVPGVSEVYYQTGYLAVYQQPTNQLLVAAVGLPTDAFKDLSLSEEQLKAFSVRRDGMLVGAQLAQRNHWSAGQQVPLHVGGFLNKDGNDTQLFEVLGVYHGLTADRAKLDSIAVVRWDYMNASAARQGDTVALYKVKLAAGASADDVAHAIDGITANSDHPTRTQTAQALLLSLFTQMGDLSSAMRLVVLAAIFTLVIVTATSLAHAVRRRSLEHATLRAMGYTRGMVARMVIYESVCQVLCGVIGGSALVYALLAHLRARHVPNVPDPGLDLGTFALVACGSIALAVLAGSFGAVQAARLEMAAALKQAS
ncbi:FtsX-like permease family protein [Xanthomonas campestris pv. phormiicola]|nr:FtsX-like permease family protein [Xanthomonas campestris pv. phormiicola]UYC15755.1 FtsX-like permease family protein [Xanthomonas campestris pv. phormiicola]